MNRINAKNIAIIFSILFSCAVHAANNNDLTDKQLELRRAILEKSLQEVELLLKDVNPNFCSITLMSPLLFAVKRQGQEDYKKIEWIDLLFKYNADPKLREDIPANKRLLREAALTNNLKAVKLLNEHGAMHIDRYEWLMQNENICPKVKNELRRIYEQNNHKQ